MSTCHKGEGCQHAYIVNDMSHIETTVIPYNGPIKNTADQTTKKYNVCFYIYDHKKIDFYTPDHKQTCFYTYYVTIREGHHSRH